MKNLTHLLNQILAKSVTGLFFLLLVCVLWQVLSRYLLASPSTFTDEMARLLFIWSGLLGAAYAAGQKQHLCIDLLPSTLTGVAKQRLLIVIELGCGLFALLVLVGGGSLLLTKVFSTGQLTPVMGISMAFGYAAIPVSGLFMLFYSANTLAGLIKPSQH